MKKNYNLLIFVFGSILSPLSGQQMMSSGGFYDNVMLENPAGTGMHPDDMNHIQLYYKKQYNSLQDAPTHMTATFDKVLQAERIGIGIKVMSDKFSILTQQGVEGSFAYYIGEDAGSKSDWGTGGKQRQVRTFSIGLSAGYLNRRLDESNLVVRDKDDVALWGQNPMSQHQMTLSAGAHLKLGFNNGLFQAGTAYNYALPNLFRGDTTNTLFTNDGSVIGYMRMEFPASQIVSFEPMAIVRCNGLAIFQGSRDLVLQSECSLTVNLKMSGNRFEEYLPRVFIRGGIKTFQEKAIKAQFCFATGFQFKKNFQIVYLLENSNVGLGSSNELGMHFAF